MSYKYRVTLEGIKGFFRIYQLSGDNTLYTFHKQLRSDLEFTIDQPILFKALDASGKVLARYALFAAGEILPADSVTVAQTVEAGVASFVYFYDIAGRKSVTITLEEELPGDVRLPVLLESKGPVPREFENGYVAFEDQPQQRRRIVEASAGADELEDDEDDEDEDEDDEDDEDGDEEEEVVFDGNF